MTFDPAVEIFSGLFSLAFGGFSCKVLLISRLKVDPGRNMGSKHKHDKKRSLRKVSKQEEVVTKLNGHITCCLQLKMFFLGAKFLVLICGSLQVSKKSYWEFVGELSNTIVESRDTRKSKGVRKGAKN